MDLEEKAMAGCLSEIASLRADVIAEILKHQREQRSSIPRLRHYLGTASRRSARGDLVEALRWAASSMDDFAAESQGRLVDGLDQRASRLILGAQKLRERADTLESEPSGADRSPGLGPTATAADSGSVLAPSRAARESTRGGPRRHVREGSSERRRDRRPGS